MRMNEEFLSRHGLPDKFSDLIDAYYSPLAEWVVQRHEPGQTLFLGIGGAQGTGKSTLATFLQFALESDAGLRVAVMSLDDFYLTKAERKELARRVHPLLETRGVPGTHDMQLLATCIEQLKNPDNRTKIPVPRFDKIMDDRADPDTWPELTGPIDLIILEGWCIGCRPQSDDALVQPINSLERDEDPSGEWRRYVNEQLNESYADLFAQLDALIFLRAPGMGAVYRWRLEQEEKLAANTVDGAAGIMDSEQVARFVQYFERLTRESLVSLPDYADFVLELDDNHDCARSIYQPRSVQSKSR
jgi:D-glycerate 3-kinase